jgi:hypothetical protein
MNENLKEARNIGLIGVEKEISDLKEIELINFMETLC